MKNHNVVATAVAAVAFPLLSLSFVPAAGAVSGKTVTQVPQSQATSALLRAKGGSAPADKVAVNFGQAKPEKPKKDRSSKEKTGRRRSRKSAVPNEARGEYKALVSQFAREYGVPVALAHAIVTVESNYYPKALGKAGEIGLMQIKPSTARGMGYRGASSGLYHPETNIRYGMKYLAAAYKLGGKTTCGAILKYNAGHGAKRMNPVSSAYCAKVKSIMAK